MNKTITLDNLILLAYNETDKIETEELCSILSSDEEMLEEYIAICSVKNNLDELYAEPSDDIISGLVNYSKALEIIRPKPNAERATIINN